MKKDKKGASLFQLTVLGIGLNLFLSILKFTAGAVSHSVTVTADGWNNLTDAGTTAVTMFGLWAAGCGAGKHHPYGHGRLEWLLGMLASASVITIGFELLKTSVSALYRGQQSDYQTVVFFVLFLSVAVKIWMYFYQKRAGLAMESETLKAMSKDSLSDAFATGAVLISAFVTRFTEWDIDGWCGIGVAVLILANGLKSFAEIVEKVIGTQPEGSILQEVEDIISKQEGVACFYGLNIHDYGLKHYIVSVKILGKDSGIFTKALELSLMLEQKYNCSCTVQAGIAAEESNEIKQLRKDLNEKAEEIHPLLELTNCRFIRAGEHTLITADLCVPISLQKKEDMILKELRHTAGKAGTQYQLELSPFVENNHIRSWKTLKKSKKQKGWG